MEFTNSLEIIFFKFSPKVLSSDVKTRLISSKKTIIKIKPKLFNLTKTVSKTPFLNLGLASQMVSKIFCI